MDSWAGGNGVKKSKVIQNLLKHNLISKILKSDRIFFLGGGRFPSATILVNFFAEAARGFYVKFCCCHKYKPNLVKNMQGGARIIGS